MPRIRFDNCVDYRMAGKKKDKIEDIKAESFSLILDENLQIRKSFRFNLLDLFSIPQ